MTRSRRTIGIAQVLLVVGAASVWVAARLPWVVIRSFDGLAPPKSVTLSGASWSTALLPVAALWLAAAIAALAVRGWALRALAVLSAVTSLAVGYLAVSLWQGPDVAARGADLAHVPLTTLVGSERHYWGAVVALVSTACTVVAAALLMRSASHGTGGGPTKYATPAARRAGVSQQQASATDAAQEPQLSERMIWDALDEGSDPTQDPTEDPGAPPPDSDERAGTEGR